MAQRGTLDVKSMGFHILRRIVKIFREWIPFFK